MSSPSSAKGRSGTIASGCSAGQTLMQASVHTYSPGEGQRPTVNVGQPVGFVVPWGLTSCWLAYTTDSRSPLRRRVASSAVPTGVTCSSRPPHWR